MVFNDSKEISNVVETNSKLLGSKFYGNKVECCFEDKSLSQGLVNSKSKKVRLKPIPSRIDYNFFNYCSTCELKYPKQILRCNDCNQKVRTRPWHRSKIIVRKRI